MTIETYGLELEQDAEGWLILWPQVQTDAYGVEAALAHGTGYPTQADYDSALRIWAIAHVAGALPQPLGCQSAEEILAQPGHSAQNAPGVETMQ